MAEPAGEHGWWQDPEKPDRLPPWWEENLADPPYSFGLTELQKERLSIKGGIELRYSLLEAATRRLAASIKRTGLPAIQDDAKEDEDAEHQKSMAEALSGARPEKSFELPPLSTWQLATIDVFVEKAQHLLVERAKTHYASAKFFLAATIITMVVAGLFAFAKAFGVAADPIKLSVQSDKWWQPLFVFLENAILLSLILGIAYFMASLARAFYHEGTILENRRHSLRLGRLYLHLKVSSARSPRHLAEIIAGLGVADVERCFGWNLETSTAFKDIRPEAMTTMLFGQMLTELRKTYEAVSKKPLS